MTAVYQGVHKVGPEEHNLEQLNAANQKACGHSQMIP